MFKILHPVFWTTPRAASNSAGAFSFHFFDRLAFASRTTAELYFGAG